MDELKHSILKESETLEDYPDKYLKIDGQSNYCYVEFKEKTYVSRKLILSASSDEKGDVFVVYGHYDVMNDSLICTTKKVITMFETIEDNGNALVIPLNQVLNIKGNGEYYLDIQDINELLSFNKKNKEVSAEKIIIKKIGSL